MPTRPEVPANVVDAVEGLHQAIDAAARPLHERHRDRLRCARGCSGCCVDGLTVFEVEAAAIVRRHPAVLADEPHAAGACAFLDGDGSCRIYDARPYVCRTQGLPLRWRDDDGAERRDVCRLNEAGEPLEALPAADCWPIGPVEERLAKMQAMVDGGALRRIALRALFERP
jgi:hypothetical protein